MSAVTLDGSTRTTPVLSFSDFRSLLARYLIPHRGRAAWMSLLLLASIAFQLASPQVIRYFLDVAQAGGDLRALYTAAGLFISFSILQQVLTVASDLASREVGLSATNDLRADLALHCLQLDLSFHKRRTPGEMIERIDGDVNELANFFSKFSVHVAGNSLLVLGIIALLFRENPGLGAGMLAYTLVTLFALGLIQRIAAPRWEAERQAHADLFGFLEERISGAEDVRTAGAEAHTLRRLDGLLQHLLRVRRVSSVVSGLSFNLTNLIIIAGYAAGLATGAVLYLNGAASLGAAYVITFYVGMLSDPLQALRAQAQDFQQASASARRVMELFAQQPSSQDVPGTPLPGGSLSLRLETVTFRYEDQPQSAAEGSPEGGEDASDRPDRADAVDVRPDVLRGLSLDLQPGRVLGILGRTGSGKSTITRLLFRLYEPTGGSIFLANRELRTIPLTALRDRVGLVTQDVQIFHATVRENLAFFNPGISDDRLEAVLRSLRLWDWVRTLPGGLNARLEGAAGLSAGEAQLLAFTRVFLKNPGLVILDEASSRLDPSTETLLERAVDRLFDGRTGVVVAHRLKTVQRADDILILEGGCAVEYGPRAVLAANPASRYSGLLRTGLEEVLV
jgi:ATP-binding cassette subfamily B protein